MPTTIKLQSPAKTNLFLRIIKRRPDGYHELASLFHALDLFDTITFSFAEQDELTCGDPAVPTGSTNLILRATQLFRERTNTTQQFRIHLEKKIPMEAGLGGGSSNCATTLWACNQLLQTNISDETLSEWGAELGSDVPFFLSTGCAYVTGRGENVQSLAPIPQLTGIIYKPAAIGCSTAAVYKALDISALPKRECAAALASFQEGNGSCFNDLQDAAFSVAPELQEIYSTLQLTYKQVILSGSGSSFFAITDNPSVTNAVDGTTPVCTITRNLSEWYR